MKFDSTANVLSVTELTGYIKVLMESDELLQDVWVRGELSGFKRHAPSGHLYFTLKDGSSQISGAMWRSSASLLRFNPEDGLKVVVHGRLSLYPTRGTYQIICSEMEPEGMGSLFLAFEQLKKKLKEEGLFDAKYKRSLPVNPRKIALITSPTGAVVHDMVINIRRRMPSVHLILVPTQVQGEDAPASIIHSLRLANQIPDLDLIILGRGGGSMEDLWCFNDEQVAREIRASQTPVISAVGHETDFTIADFAADLRASTPTEAAVKAVPNRVDLKNQLQQLSIRLQRGMEREMQIRQQALDNLASQRVFRYPMDYLNQKRLALDEQAIRLEEIPRQNVAAQQESLKGLAGTLNALSPLAVMGRGYSIARKLPQKTIVRSIKELSHGDSIELLLKDGSATAQVLETQPLDNKMEIA